jgi:hypothetical protein
MKIVYEIAAPDDKDAFLPQARQPLADLEMERRRLRLVDAELDV